MPCTRPTVQLPSILGTESKLSQIKNTPSLLSAQEPPGAPEFAGRSLDMLLHLLEEHAQHVYKSAPEART